MAAAEGDDADVFGYHFENGMLAVNLFHMRGGKMVDRREFFWEDLPEFAVERTNVHRHVEPCRDSRLRLSERATAELAEATMDSAAAPVRRTDVHRSRPTTRGASASRTLRASG